MTSPEQTGKLARGHQSMILAHRAMGEDLQRIIDGATDVTADRLLPYLAYTRRIVEIIEHHHEGEDEFLWPALRKRGADVDSLELMATEHAGLSDLVRTLSSVLARLDGTPIPADAYAVRDAARAVREVLLAHCADEEADLRGRLNPVLDGRVWKSFEKHMVRTAPRWTLWFMPAWLASVAEPEEMWAVPGRPIAALAGWRLRRLRRDAFGAE